MIPTYYHSAAPPGHPCPWWYQAMAQMWYWVAMLEAHTIRLSPEAYDEMLHRINNPRPPSESLKKLFATGGNVPKTRHPNVWIKK